MTLACRGPALSTGNSPYINWYTSFGYIYPDFLTVPHPAHSPKFAWPPTSNFQHLQYVCWVCAASCAVGSMIVCSMTVVIHSAPYCALTTASMTRLTSLTDILFVSFVCNLVWIVLPDSDGQDNITFLAYPSTRFAVKNIGMAYPTLPHAYTNYHVSQFGHWNQVKAER